MEFGLSEEQVILQESVRRLFEEQSPLDRVRDIAETGTGFDEALWSSVVELGILGALVPEQYGGLAMSFFDAFLVLEAAGRCTAPVPLLGTMVQAPLAVSLAGSEAQKEEYLPKLASGQCRAGIALGELLAQRDEAGLTLEGDKLSGKSLYAMDAGIADIFVVAIGGDTLALVARDAPGLSINLLLTIDKTRAVAELNFDNIWALAWQAIRRASSGTWSKAWAAYQIRARVGSRSATISAHMCLTAWKEPMGRLNCWRSWA